MARTRLDEELGELKEQIVRLGSLVDTALERALEALKTRDLAMCGLIIASETLIDDLRREIAQHAFRLLTLQQPLGGQDLRFIASASIIAGELERIGDGAEGIAELLVRMAAPENLPDAQVKLSPIQSVPGRAEENVAMWSPTEPSIVQEMLDLGHEARRVLQGTIKALAKSDARAARYIWEEDDVVDVRYHMVRHSLMTKLEGAHAATAVARDTWILQRMTFYLWMAHNLERVADHCTNICERILFVVEGDNKSLPTKDSKA
jgi:phosphate transport system protein